MLHLVYLQAVVKLNQQIWFPMKEVNVWWFSSFSTHLNVWFSECLEFLRGVGAQEGNEWWFWWRIFGRRECTEGGGFCREEIICREKLNSFLFIPLPFPDEKASLYAEKFKILKRIALHFLEMGYDQVKFHYFVNIYNSFDDFCFWRSSVCWCSPIVTIQDIVLHPRWFFGLCDWGVVAVIAQKLASGSSRLSLRLFFVLDVNDKSLAGFIQSAITYM